MNTNEIARELRLISGGGLISAKEVGAFVRDKNSSRVRAKYLKDLENLSGKYLITDVAKVLRKEFRR